MSQSLAIAHSLVEIDLFFMICRCDSCEAGTVQTRTSPAVVKEGDTWKVTVEAQCSACGTKREISFQMRTEPVSGSSWRPAVVSATERPSRIIDVAQWLTLYRMMMEAAEKAPTKEESWRLKIRAGLCLDEALKFYDDPDNDLPSTDAFFHGDSLDRHRSHPQQFSRRRLLDLRARLPAGAIGTDAF